MTAPIDRPSDYALLDAWRSGDRRCGELLFERHVEDVYRFFCSKIGGDAEDLTQRTFLACVESKERIRGEASFRTFLFAVARNVLGKHYRRKRRRSARTEHLTSSVRDPAPSNSTVMARTEERDDLREALRRLPREHRRVLELYYWEQRTSAEIARVLGVPHGTARTRIRRARVLLREQLERHRTPRPAWPAQAEACSRSQVSTSANAVWETSSAA